jgi:proteic killer suppression protein
VGPGPVDGPRPTRCAKEKATGMLDNNNAARYYSDMIKSFSSKDTEKLFYRKSSSDVPADIRKVALRKLLILDAAENLDDLRIPPGNRLEKLSRDRLGQHSIRINDQWRICFRWSGSDALDVEIVDYH